VPGAQVAVTGISKNQNNQPRHRVAIAAGTLNTSYNFVDELLEKMKKLSDKQSKELATYCAAVAVFLLLVAGFYKAPGGLYAYNYISTEHLRRRFPILTLPCLLRDRTTRC